MKFIFSCLIGLFFLSQAAVAQLPISVLTTRIDTGGVAESTMNGGALARDIGTIVSQNDSEYDVSETLAVGGIGVEAAYLDALASFDGLFYNWISPARDTTIAIFEHDTNSTHGLFAKADCPLEAIAGGDTAQTAYSEHLVNERQPGFPLDDGEYTLHAHLHILASGAETKNLVSCDLHAHVGTSFVTAEYLGDGNFYYFASLADDTEGYDNDRIRDNDDPTFNQQVIEGVWPNGLDHHFFAKEVVEEGDIIFVDTVESSETFSHRGSIQFLQQGNCRNDGQTADIWAFKAFASGYVDDEG